MPGPKMIGAGARAGRRISEEASGQILHPGDEMYHGRIGKAPEGSRRQLEDDWRQAHRVAERAQANHDRDEHFYRGFTRDFAAINAGLAGVSLAGGYASRKILQRQNKKMERKLGVAKWDENEPFMITSERRDNGPHKVSTMSVKPKLNRTFSRSARFGRHLLSEKGLITGTAIITASSAAGIPLMVRDANRNEDLKRALAHRKVTGQKSPVRKISPVQRLALDYLKRSPNLSAEHSVRARALSHQIGMRESGNLQTFRQRNARDDFALRSRLKRERFQQRTWDKDTGAKKPLRVSRGGRLSLPKERSLTREDREMLNRRGYGRGISKALADPQKAYESAKAKGFPGSYEEFVARSTKPSANQAAQAAAKEAKQHQPREGSAPWRGKPLRATFGNHIHPGSVRNAAISTGIAGAGLVALARTRKQTTAKADDTRRNVRAGLGAVTGAAAMDAANTIGGQSAKAVLKERRNRRGTTPHEERVWGEHKQKMLGLKPGEKIPGDDSISQAQKAKTFRHYPKTLPDWRAHRLLALKNTKGWTAGSLVGAAAIGGALGRKQTTAKNLESELPRAARRAAKKGRQILSDEEIARLRAESAARKPHARTKESSPEPAPTAPAAPHVRPRSSFLGRGQVRDLAIGVPAGGAALYYGTRRPVQKAAKGSKDNWRKAAIGSSGVAIGAHLAEGDKHVRAERELHRVISANNTDVMGRHAQADRGRHAARAIAALDDARYLRGVKGLAALGAAGAGYKAVTASKGLFPKYPYPRLKGEFGNAMRRAHEQREALGGRKSLSSDLAEQRVRRQAHFRAARDGRTREEAEYLADHAVKHARARQLRGEDGVQKADNRRTAERTAIGAVGGAALLDATDTLAGASLKRVGTVQRDRARRSMTPEQRKVMNADINAHGQRFGFTDERGRGRAPKPSDPHAAKNRFYRTYPKHLPGARVARLNSLRDKKTGPILATGALLGGALAAHSQVSKLSHAQVGLLTGSGTLGTLVGASGTRRENESHEAVGALAGGWAGQGLYQASGYGPRKLVRGVKDSKVPLHERNIPKSRMTSPEQKKAYDKFRRERRALRQQYPNQVDYKRNTPRGWHGARTERVLAHTHGGRLGTALGTGATAAGMAAGIKMAQRHDQKQGIRKAQYGYMDKKRSYPKTAEMLGGAGLLAYGIPRLKMIGPLAVKGAKAATKRGHGKEAKAVMDLGLSVGNAMRDVTGRGEMSLRQIRQIDNAISMIPPNLRGEVSAATGALLAAHAHPTTKEKFVPVD